MLKRIAAITGIFLCSWVAWAILTAVIWVRTDEKNTAMSAAVGELWGTEHVQKAPDLEAAWKTVTSEEIVWKDGEGWVPKEENKGTFVRPGESGEEPESDPDGIFGEVSSETVSDRIVSEAGDPVQGTKNVDKGKHVAMGAGDWKTDPGMKHFKVIEVAHRAPLLLDGTNGRADLRVEHRKKGLLWFATYRVTFSSVYSVRNPSGHPIDVTMHLRFPSAAAIYDNMKVTVDGNESAQVTPGAGEMVTRFVVAAGETRKVTFRYRSRGMEKWSYSFGSAPAMVRNFRLVMTTNFDDIDFPQGTVSPDAKTPTGGGKKGGGWELVWDKESVVSGLGIGMLMPDKLNPGPLAQSMSLHAPVSLFFFFFVMFILQALKGLRIHPMNYFFIACSFFAFNLLFSYLVDHLDVLLAFGIASVVSVALVVGYLRVVVGTRFALVEAALCQLVYQVLFGLAHFLEGYTGLTITIGAILSLAMVMHQTARIDWEALFRRSPSPTKSPA